MNDHKIYLSRAGGEIVQGIKKVLTILTGLTQASFKACHTNGKKIVRILGVNTVHCLVIPVKLLCTQSSHHYYRGRKREKRRREDEDARTAFLSYSSLFIVLDEMIVLPWVYRDSYA